MSSEKLYPRRLAQGSLGLGEAYVDGWWDAQDLHGLLRRLFAARAAAPRSWTATPPSFNRALPAGLPGSGTIPISTCTGAQQVAEPQLVALPQQ